MTACKKSAGDVPFGAVRFIEQPQFVKCMGSFLAATLYMDDVNFDCKTRDTKSQRKPFECDVPRLSNETN